MENKNKTPMIYLKDLVFAALYGYKRILAAALIFAILLGGLSAVSSLGALKNAEAAMAEYQQALALYQEKAASRKAQLAQMEQTIADQQEYLTLSPLMQLNPYNFYKSTLTVYVDTGYQIQPGMDYQTPDTGTVLLQCYQNTLLDTNILESLAQTVQIQPNYICELISFTPPTAADQALVITIRHATAEGAQVLADQVVAQLEAISTQLQQSIAAHDLKLVASDVHAAVDPTLAVTQKTEADRLASWQNTYKSIQSNQPALAAPAAPNVSTTSIVKDIIIRLVLGAVLGAFLAVLWLLAAHIGSSRIYAARNLRDRVDVKLLGCISSNHTKPSLDRWLRRIEGRNTADVAQQAALLAANVKNRCSNRLLVVSQAAPDVAAPVVEALRNAGLQTDAHGSLLQDKAALEALAGCDSVLLLLQCQKSVYTDAEQEMSIVRDCGKQLLGCILIDG